MSTTPRGRTAVITGAARGIGAALALRLAREGVCIAAVGLEPENLSATARRCAAHAPAQAWTADVTDHARMRAVADEVRSHFGRVDVVVANAGIGLGGLFGGSDPQAFDRVIAVNLLGSAATARAFLPALAASRGYFLQMASLAAMVPAPLMAAYCASKAGVESFAHALRAEVAHQGVGVGVAYLSWTDTDLVRSADEDEVMARFRRRLPGPARPARWPRLWSGSRPGSAAGPRTSTPRRGSARCSGCPGGWCRPRSPTVGRGRWAGWLPSCWPPRPRQRRPLGPGGQAALGPIGAPSPETGRGGRTTPGGQDAPAPPEAGAGGPAGFVRE